MGSIFPTSMGLNLTALMTESTSIIDLESRLKMAGYWFKSSKKYAYWLDSQRSRLTKDAGNRILETTPTESTLPTLLVEDNDVTYFLHGIGHGFDEKWRTGLHLRGVVKNRIGHAIRQMRCPYMGSDCFYEEGFKELFSLSGAGELKDVSLTKKEPSSTLEKGGSLAIYLPLGLLAKVAVPILARAVIVNIKNNPNPSGKYGRELNLMYNVLTDMRYQSQCTDYRIATELPQPFNLENDYILEKYSYKATLMKAFFGQPNVATGMERSLCTAKLLRGVARDQGLKEVHYACGADHTTEIAYFFKNPNYSFEPLERFRTGNFANC